MGEVEVEVEALAQALKEALGGAVVVGAARGARAATSVGYPISRRGLSLAIEAGALPARRRHDGGHLLMSVDDLAAYLIGRPVGGR
ncbi:MAG: hypothetical protein KF878_09750 [Planctomycetes bacterium]|nr:hypothetical protein [Planctomycetota bacterium]